MSWRPTVRSTSLPRATMISSGRRRRQDAREACKEVQDLFASISARFLRLTIRLGVRSLLGRSSPPKLLDGAYVARDWRSSWLPLVCKGSGPGAYSPSVLARDERANLGKQSSNGRLGAGITRRRFLRALTAGTALVALSGSLGCEPSSRTRAS